MHQHRSNEAPNSDAGMTTAEYAVGTIAACGFAGVLFEVVKSPAVQRMIIHALQRAFSVLGW